METPWKILGLVYVLVTSACIFLFEWESEWECECMQLLGWAASCSHWCHYEKNMTPTVVQDLKYTKVTQVLHLLKVSRRNLVYFTNDWHYIEFNKPEGNRLLSRWEMQSVQFGDTWFCSSLLRIELASCLTAPITKSTNISPKRLPKGLNSYLLIPFAIIGSKS